MRAAAGKQARIDVSGAHFWDITAVGALDKVMERLRQHGCRVVLKGLDDASQRLIERIRV